MSGRFLSATELDCEPLDQTGSKTTQTIAIASGSNEEAPPPSGSEGGAVGAIADHSTAGISGPPAIEVAAADEDARPGDTAGSRQTDRGPEVEATGDKSPGYYRAERQAVIRLAEIWHGIGTGKYPTPGPLDDAIRAAVALVPVLVCPGCGETFVQGDARRRTYCSVRCQQRMAKRLQRAKAKAMSPIDGRREAR